MNITTLDVRLIYISVIGLSYVLYNYLGMDYDKERLEKVQSLVMMIVQFIAIITMCFLFYDAFFGDRKKKDEKMKKLETDYAKTIAELEAIKFEHDIDKDEVKRLKKELEDEVKHGEKIIYRSVEYITKLIKERNIADKKNKEEIKQELKNLVDDTTPIAVVDVVDSCKINEEVKQNKEQVKEVKVE